MGEELSGLGPSTATITLTRAQAKSGALVSYLVLVDGTQVGQVANGESATFEVAWGSHRVQLRCMGKTSNEVTVTAMPGVTVTLECGLPEAMQGRIGRALRLGSPCQALWTADPWLPLNEAVHSLDHDPHAAASIDAPGWMFFALLGNAVVAAALIVGAGRYGLLVALVVGGLLSPWFVGRLLAVARRRGSYR